MRYVVAYCNIPQDTFLGGRGGGGLYALDIPVPKGSVMDSVWPAPSEIITTGKKGTRRDKKGRLKYSVSIFIT